LNFPTNKSEQFKKLNSEAVDKIVKKSIKQHKKEMTVKKNKKKAVKLVAVYGTLLSKCPNNGHLQNAELLGTFQTEPGLSLYLAPGRAYPYIMKNGVQSVTMEVYALDSKATEDRIDQLEGVSVGFYEKEETFKTPFGPAIAYYRKEKMEANDAMIMSGSWKEYKAVGL
tara:strand:+ start:24547 stop:25053 length:507 start_codon:yes stop_codon:yes gene_type:complete